MFKRLKRFWLLISRWTLVITLPAMMAFLFSSPASAAANSVVAIGKINPSTGSITEYTSGLTIDRSIPAWIVTGPDGNLWFTDENGAIGKVTLPPKVTKVSPSRGPATGGTLVTITGTGLSTVSAVYFGSNAATIYSVCTDTSMNAVSPPGTGTVDVTIFGPGGSSATSANDQFTYTGTGGRAPILSIATTTLNPATVGQPYIQTVTTNNEGTAPYTFSVTSGTLPDGLTLSSGTGVISGTPTTAGTYAFIITVKDADSSSASESYSLTVNTTGSAIVTPSVGGTITLGNNASIAIPAGALQGNADVNVMIQSVDSPPAAPKGYSIMGAYEFTVDGQHHYTFNSPVTLTFHFDPSKVAKGTTPAVYYYDGTKWVLVAGTVNWTSDTLTVTVDHFTEYAVMAQIPAITLSDITGSWAQANIEKLVSLGAISGYPDGTFRPNSDITRAEFVTVLVKALNLAPKAGPVFADTKGSWAQSYISTAAAYGIVSGYDATCFGPNDLITREQMAVMVVKAAKLAAVTGELSFKDADSIDAWANEYVATAVKNGIISGYPDGTFRPLTYATRAEAVTVIAILLK